MYELNKKPRIYNFTERPFEARIVAVPSLFENLSGTLDPRVFPQSKKNYDELRIKAATTYFNTIGKYFELCKKAADEAYGYITAEVLAHNQLFLDHSNEILHPESSHLMHITHESIHGPTKNNPFEKVGYLVNAYFPEFDDHVNRNAVFESQLFLLTNRNELEKLINRPQVA